MDGGKIFFGKRFVDRLGTGSLNPLIARRERGNRDSFMRKEFHMGFSQNKPRRKRY
jgi:hypothetical protein